MRARAGRPLALGLAVACLAALPGHAREVWRSGDAYVDLGGYVREIAVVSRGTSAAEFTNQLEACYAAVFPGPLTPSGFENCPAFDLVGGKRVGTSTTRLRLRVEARANEHWSAVISVDNELIAGTLDTFEAQFAENLGTGTWADASGFEGGDRVAWAYSLYRGYVSFESQHFEAVVGRQRIPWGVGRLWNPIDRFNAIRPLAIQPDESPGVDAINARILFTDFTQLELVFAAGEDSSQNDYAARFQGTARDIDYGVVLGSFKGARTVGLDLSSNLGEAAGRAEIVYTVPTGDVWPVGAPGPGRLADFWQIVVSLDYNIDWGTGIYVLAEHLYNGNALGFGFGKAGPLLGFFEQEADCPLPSPPAPPNTKLDLCYPPASYTRFGGSQVITRSSQLTGLQAGYEITPEIRFNAMILYDWDGESAVFFPSLSYSFGSSFDWTLGVQAAAGGKYSEFGDAPTTGFLLGNFYF